jgi:hypothetical protein
VFAVIGTLLVPAAAALLLTSYQYRGTTMQYELDFAPLIVMGQPSCLGRVEQELVVTSEMVGAGR